MSRTFQAADWDQYQMDWHDPHRSLEPLQQEIDVVDAALVELVEGGILAHRQYSHELFLALRAAVRKRFEIPWTAISPRMQRLIYAINAVAQPQIIVAVGIFCGNTFISNAGAAVGPGACYRARRLIGLEIRKSEAERASTNVATIDLHGDAEIIADDGLPFLRDFDDQIDLLYLDADGGGGKGKSIYLDLLEAARHALHPGSLVLAHNSVNAASELGDYLSRVRDPAECRASANMIVDDQGLEVSICA